MDKTKQLLQNELIEYSANRDGWKRERIEQLELDRMDLCEWILQAAIHEDNAMVLSLAKSIKSTADEIERLS